MMGMRWWRLLSLVVAAVMWWGCSPAEAQQNKRVDCRADQLNSSQVDATIRFNPHDGKYVKVDSNMTIVVPEKEWPLARNLTFSEKSSEYHGAMRCLLRGQDSTSHGPDHDQEWRPHEPIVTAQKDKVTVRYDSFTWINTYDPVQLGPWKIEKKKAGDKTWDVSLQPSTLQYIPWSSISADLGGLKFNDRSARASSADERSLTWNDQLPRAQKNCSRAFLRRHQNFCIGFDVELPWQRSWILSYDQSLWSSVGVAAWWVCASLVIALTAFRAQRTYSSPVLGVLGPRWRVSSISGWRRESPAWAALQWALFSGAVALTLILLIKHPAIGTRRRTLISIAAGLTLILVARPWCHGVTPAVPNPGTGESTGPDGAQRRQARAVIATTSVVAAVGLLVVLAPGLFDLSEHLEPQAGSTTLGRIGLALMGLATVWLWLAAMVAWAWRFAREGGLVRTPRTLRCDKAPVRRIGAVGALLGAVAGALLLGIWKVTEHQWERVNWPADQSSASKRAQYISKALANFSFTDLLWIFSYSWVLAGIALFSLLHFRVQAQRSRIDSNQEQLSLGPDKPDLVLTVVVFAFTVGLRGASFVGINAQYGIWFLLSICSLVMVLAVGRRRSVLSQMGNRFYMQRLGNKKRRKELMEKAHQYRSLNRQGYLLDHGRAEGTTNEQLEDRLHYLRQWLISGCAKKNPPDQISVLDVALAWGPEDHWWSNAVRAARLAFCFGIPASGALVYLNVHGYSNWTRILFEPVRIPEVVAGFISYQAAWAGVGFVLGALWRLLPGRRGPVRAWALAVAYAMPAGLVLLFVRLTDFIPLTSADVGYLFLFSLLMLTILTLTSIWMDTATFSEERQFCPSRFTLLLSIYQVRGFSGQVVLLITQVGAVVAIYRDLVPK